MTSPTKDLVHPEVLGPQLPLMGYVKMGGKAEQAQKSRHGKEFQRPVRYDHFVVRQTTRGPDGNYLRDDAVHAVVGEEPVELNVRLPFDRPTENFYAQMVEYRGQTRVKECDGDQVYDRESQTVNPCPRRVGGECNCKPYGRLKLILEASPHFGGIYLFRTGSWGTTKSIQTVLAMLGDQFPSLRGLPLVFKMYPQEIQYTEGGEQKTRTVHRAGLFLRASFEEAREAALEYHRATQIARKEILRLSSGTRDAVDALDAEEEGEIGWEFYGTPKPPERKPVETTVGKMNRALQGGEPEPEPPELDDETIALQAQLRSLIEQAGDRVETKLKARLERAAGSGDREAIDSAVTFLRSQLEQASEEDIGRLRDLMAAAVKAERLTPEQEESIDEAIDARDGPMVRAWIRDLSTGEPDLFGREG